MPEKYILTETITSLQEIRSSYKLPEAKVHKKQGQYEMG